MDIASSSSCFTDEIAEANKTKILNAFRELPLAFVPNAGQVDSGVCYHANGSGSRIFFTPEEVVFSFVERPLRSASHKRCARKIGDVFSEQEQALQGFALSLRFIGANPTTPEGLIEGAGQVSYFIGNDPDRWHAGLPTFEEIIYRDLWPNVDLIFKGEGGQIKYEFIIHPGADINSVKLAYRGADELSLDGQGNLRVLTPFGVLTDERPVSYQLIDSRQVPVECGFLLEEQETGVNTCSFSVGESYDPRYPLVIDPGLVYSTYLGGSVEDVGYSIAIDDSGNAYVTGITYSPDFPTTPGAFQTTLKGTANGFITELNPTGSLLVYSTYLGGSNADEGIGIAVNASGNAYVTGNTSSTDFPTTPGAFQATLKGPLNAFITELNPAGSALVYSTYLGGSVEDGGIGIVIDASCNAYVTGFTESPDFPTTPGAYQTTLKGSSNAFITKLSTSPQISVAPPSLDFGNVMVGQTSPPQSLVVQNVGAFNLTIFSVTITGTNASEFHIISDTCTGSTLTPGATCTIMVVFAPSTVNPASASLVITSNACNAPILGVPLEGNGVPVPATAKDCILVNKVYDQCFTEELVTSQVPVTSACPGITIPAGATVACIPIPGSATCTFAGTVAVTPPLTPFFEEVLVLNSFDVSAPIFVAGVTVCAPTLALTGAARADLWAPPGTTVSCDILAFGDCTCTLLASPTGLPMVLACTGKICKEIQVTAPVKLLVPSYGFCDVPACTFLPQPGFACPPAPLFPPERCQATPTVAVMGTGGGGLTLGGPAPFGVVVSIVRAGTVIASATTDITGTAAFPTIGGLEGAIDVVQFTFLNKLVSFPIPIEFTDVSGFAHDSATTCSLIFTQITPGAPLYTVTINGFLLGSGTPGVPATIDP